METNATDRTRKQFARYLSRSLTVKEETFVKGNVPGMPIADGVSRVRVSVLGGVSGSGSGSGSGSEGETVA